MSGALVSRGVPVFALIVAGVNAQVSDWNDKYNAGMTALRLGHYSEGLMLLRGAYEAGKSIDEARTITTIGLASAFLEMGRNEEAEQFFSESRTILEAAGGPADQLAVVWNGLSETFLNRLRVDEGEKAIRQAVAVLDSAGNKGPVYDLCQRRLAEIRLLRKDYAGSRELLTPLIGKLRKSPAENRALLGSALSVYGRALLMLKRYGEAVNAIQESAELQRQMGADRPAYGDSLVLLSSAYRIMGHSERSQPLARKALKIYENAGDPRAAFALREIGLIAAVDGKPLTAQDYISQALAIARKASMPAMVTETFEKDLAGVPVMASNRHK